MLHIYYGDGKGKTTAALGMAIRASGAGLRVHVVQFMKGAVSGEIAVLPYIPGVTLVRFYHDFGFYKQMSEKDKEEITDLHNRMLTSVFMLAEMKRTDMLILDEFNVAYSYGLINKQTADKLILSGRYPVEIVLTGRDPDEKYLEKADYISEIKCVRHPYQKGIEARRGIEF